MAAKVHNIFRRIGGDDRHYAAGKLAGGMATPIGIAMRNCAEMNFSFPRGKKPWAGAPTLHFARRPSQAAAKPVIVPRNAVIFFGRRLARVFL
ncbi:MAG: hypothetical protein K8S55_05510 [Phycisphaerae bacterium]|nr:hypothetical protein [Phycisphaerae bacterium]